MYHKLSGKMCAFSRQRTITLIVSLVVALGFCGCDLLPVASNNTQDQTATSALDSQASLALAVEPPVAGSIHISPFMIVLNAQGEAEDILATISLTLGSGYMFTEGEATLYFNDTEVSHTTSMRYCYIDDNLLVYFDRASLLNNPDVIALGGQTVTAMVDGSFTKTDADGNTAIQEFGGTDQVLIVAPGKNGN